MNDGNAIAPNVGKMTKRVHRVAEGDVREAQKQLDEAWERLRELRKIPIYPYD